MLKNQSNAHDPLWHPRGNRANQEQRWWRGLQAPRARWGRVRQQPAPGHHVTTPACTAETVAAMNWAGRPLQAPVLGRGELHGGQPPGQGEALHRPSRPRAPPPRRPNRGTIGKCHWRRPCPLPGLLFFGQATSGGEKGQPLWMDRDRESRTSRRSSWGRGGWSRTEAGAEEKEEGEIEEDSIFQRGRRSGGGLTWRRAAAVVRSVDAVMTPAAQMNRDESSDPIAREDAVVWSRIIYSWIVRKVFSGKLIFWWEQRH